MGDLYSVFRAIIFDFLIMFFDLSFDTLTKDFKILHFNLTFFRDIFWFFFYYINWTFFSWHHFLFLCYISEQDLNICKRFSVIRSTFKYRILTKYLFSIIDGLRHYSRIFRFWYKTHGHTEIFNRTCERMLKFSSTSASQFFLSLTLLQLDAGSNIGNFWKIHTYHTY